MPKMKTHRAAAKRFRVTGTGKLKRAHANHGHILTKKSPAKKRFLRQNDLVAVNDMQRVRKMLGV